MSTWRPIATAPRDGTLVDLWIVPPSERGPGDYYVSPQDEPYRCTDCCAGSGPHDWVTNGDWIGGRRWVTGRLYYDEDGEVCRDPNDISPRARRATHWMPLPAAPDKELDE